MLPWEQSGDSTTAPCPTGVQQEGQGTVLSGHFTSLQRNLCPCPPRARPTHTIMALVMLFTWSHEWHWDMSRGAFQELPQYGRWDTAAPGAIPVPTWSQTVPQPQWSLIRWNKYTDSRKGKYLGINFSSAVWLKHEHVSLLAGFL